MVRSSPSNSPWGGKPSYLSLQRLDFDRAGEKAVLLGLSYNNDYFSSLGLSSFVNLAHEEARAILTEHIATLDALAEALLEHGTLGKDELLAIFGSIEWHRDESVYRGDGTTIDLRDDIRPLAGTADVRAEHTEQIPDVRPPQNRLLGDMGDELRG